MNRLKSISEWILPIILFAILSLIVLKNGNPLIYEPGRDGGVFLYIGKQILQGKLLYVDVWDTKGPMIYYINALGLLLGKFSRWGYGVWNSFSFLFHL